MYILNKLINKVLLIKQDKQKAQQKLNIIVKFVKNPLREAVN